MGTMKHRYMILGTLSIAVIIDKDMLTVLSFSNQTWYQFNDEEVTKIEKLGDKQPSNKVIVIDDADDETGSKEK